MYESGFIVLTPQLLIPVNSEPDHIFGSELAHGLELVIAEEAD